MYTRLPGGNKASQLVPINRTRRWFYLNNEKNRTLLLKAEIFILPTWRQTGKRQ